MFAVSTSTKSTELSFVKSAYDIKLDVASVADICAVISVAITPAVSSGALQFTFVGALT